MASLPTLTTARITSTTQGLSTAHGKLNEFLHSSRTTKSKVRERRYYSWWVFFIAPDLLGGVVSSGDYRWHILHWKIFAIIMAWVCLCMLLVHTMARRFSATRLQPNTPDYFSMFLVDTEDSFVGRRMGGTSLAKWLMTTAKYEALRMELKEAKDGGMQAISFTNKQCQGAVARTQGVAGFHDAGAGGTMAKGGMKTSTTGNPHGGRDLATRSCRSASPARRFYQILQEEALETSACLYVATGMVTFAFYRDLYSNLPTGILWRVPPGAEVCSFLRNYLSVNLVIGLFAADLWLYVKHRTMHKSFFLYNLVHATHHQFKSPTAFAGFAIHPIETVWTFLFIFLWLLPSFPHFLPVVIPLVFAFGLLNVYLHCGYAFDCVEVVLPLLFVNTSSFHNRHHEKVSTHFGEILSFWDYVFGTAGETYKDGFFSGYSWHLQRYK